jgi:hypothetical protein
MRRRLREWLPDRQAIAENRWLAPFAGTLLHPRLWHLNRRSAAGALAAGLFCGLIPGPFQMPAAALCALVFRVNLPLAMVTTLYTNPLTLVPLYILAFRIGTLTMHGDGRQFIAPPTYDSGLWSWMVEISQWMISLGQPLVVGLVLLATLLAGAGYLLMRIAWRWYLVRAWRHRVDRLSGR